jgi:hypothetical protein
VDVADLVAAVKRLLADRLVQFFAIGAVIFLVAGSPSAPDDIALTRDYLASLEAAQAQRLGVAALSAEKRGEVERRAVEDEVLYREALRLGLDRDDAVVRRHLVQKMLVLAEDLGGASREPTADDVRACYDESRERWRVDERVRFVHVFGIDRATLVALDAAVRNVPGDAPPPLGDAFPRTRDVRGGRADVAATYGDAFADAVVALPVGAWSAPIRSRFGWHLVRVIGHDGGRPAELAEVYGQVRLACAVERRHAAIARFVTAAAARYRITIDGDRVDGVAPTERVALRTLPSAED